MDKTGQSKGYNTKIAEGNWAKFFNATITLGRRGRVDQGLGRQQPVTVVYDLNACDEEYPGYGEWGSTAILVRKAKQLILQLGLP